MGIVLVLGGIKLVDISIDIVDIFCLCAESCICSVGSNKEVILIMMASKCAKADVNVVINAAVRPSSFIIKQTDKLAPNICKSSGDKKAVLTY